MAEEESGEKPKRKQLSGHAKRQRKKEREQKERRDEDSYNSVGRSWLQQDAYLGVGAQFDENAPPFELPAYGAAPAVMVKVIQAILVSLEQGQMQTPSIMWDGMLRDERIAAELGVRINGLLGQSLELAPADESDKALAVSEDCAKHIARIVPTPQAAQFMRYALGLGVGLAQRLTTRSLKSSTPTLHTWNTRFMWYDWMLRKWHIITQNRGSVVIEPEDPEWLLWEPFGPQGFMHGALLRCLAIPFAIRYWSRTWWSRHQEVAGSPIRAGILPADRTPRDESIFLSQLSNLAHEAVIRLPQGKDGNAFDMKLIEANANSWEGFKELLAHADDSIAIGILGQKQSTNGQGGLGTSKNAGEDTLLRIIRGDSQVGDVFREKLLRPWADENHGSADLAPFMAWDIDPPEDLKLKSESLKNFSAALTALTALPASDQHIDIRALCEEYQMPLKEESEVPEADPEEPGATPVPTGEPPHEEPDGDEGLNPEKPSDGDGDKDDA